MRIMQICKFVCALSQRAVRIRIFVDLHKICVICITRVPHKFFSVGSLNEENEKLINENLRLLSENAALYDAKRRAELLERELNLFSKENFTAEAAYVIGQDPQESGSWIEIDKGENQEIKEGMPVIVLPNILVGKISETRANSARAILLANPQSAVSAITASSGSAGVVQGENGMGMV